MIRRLIHTLMIRWHRWRVFRTKPGSPERERAVRSYLAWHYRFYGRLD